MLIKRGLILFFLFIVFVLSSGCEGMSQGVEEQELPLYSTEYDSSANGEENLQKAMKRVATNGKKILIIVGGDWCRWCTKLDEFIESDEEISNKLYSQFEVVKVYLGMKMHEGSRRLLKKYNTPRISPHFLVLDKEGNLVVSYKTVALEEGNGYSKSKLLGFIEEYK
jgi:thioredoxin-related protein